jgi:Zn-dependent peptidase ImmA (M78 family)
MDESFLEAIASARQLFLHHKNHNKNQLDKQVRLTSIREPGWDSGAKKVGLLESASRILGMSITVKEFPVMGGHDEPIHAMLMRYENRALIYVSEDENFCYKRFYIAKELCHLLMDNGKEDRFIHTSKDIKKLLSDLSLQDGLSTENEYPAYRSEILAYWGAVELLLPSEYEEKALELLRAGGSNSLHNTALEFRAPKAIVGRRYLDESFLRIYAEAYKEHSYKTIIMQPVALGPNRPQH